MIRVHAVPARNSNSRRGRKILQEMNSNPELKNKTVQMQILPQGGKKEEK